MTDSKKKIRNINDLREVALLTLERLRDGEISTGEAAATGKVVDSVLGTIKSQLEYSRASGQEAFIEFMIDENAPRVIEHNSYKELE